jgi:hypothetical protein
MNTLITSPADTITFYLGKESEECKPMVDHFRKTISSFENVEDFRDAHIICVENSANGNHLQSCYGVTIAMDILRKNPEAKVILYGFLPMKFIRTKTPEIDIVLKHQNAFWMEAPFAKESLMKIFKSDKSEMIGDYTVTREAQKYLSHIFHDIKYVKNWETNPAVEDQAKFQKCMNLVKDRFPSFVNATDTEIVKFLQSVSESRPEVMKGQKISGVYCDVEGTLLIDEKINETVLMLLQKYETEGKTITIWTDGDIAEIEPKLRTLGVTYPIKSKFDHAGAIAEIAIDDQDEFTFGARTKISAEKFIRVSDLK